MFCTFWVDERQYTPCCQWADDEGLTAEAETWDCEACPVALAVEQLAPENAGAWRLYHQIAQRVVVETAIAPVVFERLTRDVPADEMGDLVDRLSIIDEFLRPPPKATRSDD